MCDSTTTTTTTTTSNNKMSTLRSSKKKGKKGKKDDKKAVFGVALDPNSNEVPIVLRKVVEYFQTTGVNIEGLFRISGAMSQMHALKASFEDGTCVVVVSVSCSID